MIYLYCGDNMYDNNNFDENQDDNEYIDYNKSYKKEGFFKRLFGGKKKEKKEEKEFDNFYQRAYQQEEPVVKDDLVKKREIKDYGKPVPKEPEKVTVSQMLNKKPSEFVNNRKNDGELEFNYYQEPVIIEQKPEAAINKKTAYIIMGALGGLALIIFLITIISKSSTKYELAVGFNSISLRSGESMQIPVLTNDTARTKYTIDNSNIATVISNGFIQAKEFKENKQYLQTKLKIGGEQINKTITVYIVQSKAIIPLENFEVQESITLKRGERKMIEITNIKPPYNTQTLKYVYESSDSGIAIVDSMGVITGVKAGNTTVKVRNTSNQELNKVIKITVN